MKKMITYLAGAALAGAAVFCLIGGTFKTPEAGYPDAGRVQEYIHYMRITMSGAAVAPTSLGRVRALFR